MLPDPAVIRPPRARRVDSSGITTGASRGSIPLNLDEQLLTPAEVGKLFRVDPKTVTRWAQSGKLSAVRTLGGHRRYRAAEVQALREGTPLAPSTPVGEVA